MGEVIIGYIGTFSESFNVAVLVWPLLSLLLSVPVLVALYRRDGWLPLTTVFAVYASILYAAGLVCFTLYPLPTGDAGPGITYGVPPILDPLNFVRDIAEGGVRAVFQLLFNIVLFVPLGFIARTLLKLKLPLMLALSFAATCLIETAQFTGLSGAYLFAYRTFDVDDLICNTLGSLIGWGLAHLAVRLTQREAEVQHEMWRLRSERELFVEIEKSLESKTRRIQMLLDSLPDSNDPDSIARRREMLVEVKLLVAYCKRKGALVLAEKSDPEFNRERLQLVFNETAADLRSIGVECAALVQTNTSQPASVVSVLYDCLYDFATVANAASDAVLMLFVQQDERRVQLRAMLDSSDAESERMAATFDELRASLEKHRVEYSIETDSSSASLVAYVPLSTKGGK